MNGALWWLFPDGRLEQVLVYAHTGDWKSALYFNAIPTKTSFFLIGRETHPVDKSALYQQSKEKQLEVVVRGWAEGGGFSVSPDGCRAAFGIDTRGFKVEGPRRYRLHILDACN
jgi:hypothetical protein